MEFRIADTFTDALAKLAHAGGRRSGLASLEREGSAKPLGEVGVAGVDGDNFFVHI
jgi:hypothetical protein